MKPKLRANLQQQHQEDHEDWGLPEVAGLLSEVSTD